MSGEETILYRTAKNWFSTIDPDLFKDRPIHYLEIGVLYGGNVVSVESSYAAHPESKLYCIDPWQDYEEYPEATYKNKLGGIYSAFLNNIANTGKHEKFIIRRGFSNIEVPQFEDEFFDMIYIDGNHETKYVYEDAILSFQKLKKNGYLIFDDHSWGTVRKAIEQFLKEYSAQIEYLGLVNDQVFVKKL